MQEKIKQITDEVNAIIIGPRDTLVITLPDGAGHDEVQALSNALGKNKMLINRVLILAGDVKLAVVESKVPEERSMKGVC